MEFAVLDWMQQTLRCGFLDALAPAVSRLCDHGEIWIVLAVVLTLFKKTRPIGLSVALALVLDLICCNLVLKPLVGRLRPYEINQAVALLVPPLRDASFPSGHAAASFAATAALRGSGSRLWLAALGLSVVIALSRLYLYVHWPSDVLAGALLGAVLGTVGARLVTRWKNIRARSA